MNLCTYNTYCCNISKNKKIEYSFRKDIGLIVLKEQIYYMKSKLHFSNHWHVMKTSVLPYIQAFYIRNNKLYYEEILEITRILYQSGIYEFQKRHNFGMENKGIKNRHREGSHSENDKMSLTIAHLELAFVILIIGYILCVVSFAVEYIFFYFSKK